MSAQADTTDHFGQAAIPSGKTTVADQAVADTQALIAKRVRHARERKGVPRRVLSELSGVSQRYLAQLEAGQGNVSIGLLKRVAHALEIPIEWLISEEAPWSSETQKVAGLFRDADRLTKDAVLQALGNGLAKNPRANRICLIGLRGAGKSTLGELAAKALGVPFLELNNQIEEIGGMPVAEIMALYGHEGYRKLELEALNHVATSHETVLLAAAGGVVGEPETFQTLLTNYNTIWLKASPQEHMDRVRAQGDERPMAGNPKAMEQLKSILKSREDFYSKAQFQLDTSGAQQDASLNQLLAIIGNNGFLA
jgi:XRE family aerobic/anaerobic benzoate catabolism transcriptional regulator